jgi:5-methyltetrahydrofolate--homocysteine methyltransferase
LRGRYPQILTDPVVGESASKLFDDARRMLDQLIADRALHARGVWGLFPANAVGEDIDIYTDAARSGVLTRLHCLRQQADKREDGTANYSLVDFIAPASSGRLDHVGAFAVTSGEGVDALVARYERQHDDYNKIMVQALADRLAEAFAEMLHKKVRAEWGFGRTENLTTEDLIRERYRGIRPAPGYPACPDHTEKPKLFQLLDVERHTGIRLTENFAMLPASSVSGMYFAHPESKYFSVGKINRDQVEDYARRKGMSVAEIEHWLSPWLAYDPS